MTTEFYANFIKETTFDPETNSVRSKLDEAATDTKKKPAAKTPKVEVEPTEIPEELHGDQHKLDHNKDMKISASDMKMVRKKGAVKDHPMKEEEELEEGTFKVQVDGLPTMYIEGSSAGSIKAQMRKKFKDPKAVVNVERITSTEKKQELRAKMSEDQAAIDAYLKKGGKITKAPAATAAGAHGRPDPGKGIAGQLNKSDTSRFKTQKKVKSMEDVEQVDEISGKTLASYSQGASTDMYGRALRKGMDIQRGSSDKDNDRKIKNRGIGIAKANMRMAGKMAKHNEDTESLQKESMMGHSDAEKLGSSKDSSHSSAASHIDYHLRRHPQQASASGGQRDKLRHQVAKKLGYVSEGGMKRIATQDAEKERLGPKVKGSGLDTFKKKPMGEKFANAAQQAAVMADIKASGKYKKPKESVEEKDTHVTKDGKTAKKGLWYNIHKKRARGEAPAKPGDPDRPSAADLKRSQ